MTEISLIVTLNNQTTFTQHREYDYSQLKYTWAPQKVHNTPVMNILKGNFCIILFSKKRIKETNMKF